MTSNAAPALPCVAFLLHFARIMLLESVKNLFQNGLNRVILTIKVYKPTAIDLSALKLSKL